MIFNFTTRLQYWTTPPTIFPHGNSDPSGKSSVCFNIENTVKGYHAYQSM